VNALAITGTNQANPLAGLTTVPTANAPQATPAFVNLIGLFLSEKIPTAKTSVTILSPAVIADAMIRSMLDNQLGSNNPASVPSATTLGTANLQQDNTATPAKTDSVATDPTTNLSIALRANGATPNMASPNQAQSLRKQLRGGPDLLLVTTVVIAPTPVFIAASGVAQPTSAPAVPFSIDTSAPAASTNSLDQPSPAGAIAFTAILTPMKEVSVAPQLTAGGSLSVPAMTLPAAVPSTIASESTTRQGSHSQADQASIGHAPGETASLGTQPGTEQGGDTPSRQKQSDSPETPTGVSIDTKIKLATAKQDDGATQGIAAAATGTLHPSSVILPGGAPIASISDQAHAATTQSDGTATPFRSTADALRASEPDMAPAPQLRTGAVQEISIRIAPPDAPPVDLRVVERSGQVHIDVRTPDAGMQTSLRQDLGTLTNSLKSAGYHTETFTPSSSLARAASSAQMSNQDDRQDSSQNRGGSGSFSEGRRQQQQQKRPSTRLAELEDKK
jgi:Flagellar hook-length control protein FliK